MVLVDHRQPPEEPHRAQPSATVSPRSRCSPPRSCWHAACGSSSKSSRHDDAGRQLGRQGHPAPRLLPERHPRPRDHRAPEQDVRRTTLGSNVTLKTSTFNAGTDETTALLAGALDAAFVGPNPAINAYQKSNGDADPHRVRRRVGRRVPRREAAIIKTAADLKGKKIATPRSATRRTSRCAPGSTRRATRPPRTAAATSRSSRRTTPTTLTAFETGAIDGAWVPEPYATQLAAGGRQGPRRRGDAVAEGQVRDDEPHRHHEVPRRPPRRHRQPHQGPRQLDRPDQDRPGARRSSSSPTASARSTGKTLDDLVIARRSRTSRSRSTRSPRRCKTDAANAKALGFIDSTDLKNIYDLTLLNKVLQDQGKDADHAVNRSARPRARSSPRVRLPPTSRRSASGRLRRRRHQGVRHRQPAGRRARGRHPRRRAGRVRLPARRVGLRQEHAAQPHRRARPADVGHGRRPRRPHRR